MELFVGRMGMSYSQYMETDLLVLFIAFSGWLKQKKTDVESLRILIVEQTVRLMNVSGKMVKKEITMKDFGINIGGRPKLTKAQKAEKVAKARAIVWKVGPKGKN